MTRTLLIKDSGSLLKKKADQSRISEYIKVRYPKAKILGFIKYDTDIKAVLDF